MVIIPCGKAKKVTSVPVQAWTLYTGGYFKTLLNLAIRLDKDVRILSAGYGLLKLNDMVLPYELKINNKRAKKFRDMYVIHTLAPGIPKYRSLLPRAYNEVFPQGSYEKLVPSTMTGMGYILQWAKKEAEDKPILLHVNQLSNGERRELIPQTFHEVSND